MKTILLIIITATLLICGKSIASDVKKLTVTEQQQYSVIGTVVLNGKEYQKVIPADKTRQSKQSSKVTGITKKIDLFAGDLIKNGDLSLVARLNGNFFLSIKNENAINAIASEYGLNVEYKNGKLAVVKAKDGIELSSLLSKLQDDSRISVANLEKVSNKMKPQ